MVDRVSILDVPIDPVTQQSALDRLLSMLELEGQKHVMTPNSEMLVEAFRNPEFKTILNQSELNLPDSIGLKIMSWGKIPQRVTGVDTVTALCMQLDECHPVFLLGAKEGIAERTAEKLMNANHKLVICGVHAGSPSEKKSSDIIAMINAAKPHLLLVAFGAPAQDLWIAKYITQLHSVRVAMGVGGTFDFLVGERKRAPRLLQSLGLEWLWRVVHEPKRIGRIVNAVVVFPVLCVREKVFGK